MTVESIGLRNFRRFAVQRDEDLTGNSGTGIVAVGVLLPSGWAIMHWLTAINSTTVFPSMANVEALHGHNGRTRVVWIDEESRP